MIASQPVPNEVIYAERSRNVIERGHIKRPLKIFEPVYWFALLPLVFSPSSSLAVWVAVHDHIILLAVFALLCISVL